MANVNVTSDAWTEISITSGTVQNISATADIELSADQVNNSGVVLKPAEIYQWDNETIYARAVTEDTGALRVVNFKKAAGGGGGYVLPVASASTLGGVKVGSNLSIDESGVLSANAGGYTLPPATASTLGGVIVGDNLTVDANGEISTHAPYSLPAATASTLGGVKIGDNISVDANGEISVAAPYSLPKAAANTLGGVKIGSNVSVDGDGVISVAAPYSLPTAAANTLGGVKVGTNLNIDADGVLSASTDPVGRVVFDVILRDGYVRANGATVNDAGTNYPNLIAFLTDNPSLLAADAAAYAANKLLYLYDSGEDTLVLPDYVGRVPQGAASVATIEAGLPNIKGTVPMGGMGSSGPDDNPVGTILTNGALNWSVEGRSSSLSWTTYSGGYVGNRVGVDASQVSSIYSDSVTTVQPPAAGLIPQIKY